MSTQKPPSDPADFLRITPVPIRPGDAQDTAGPHPPARRRAILPVAAGLLLLAAIAVFVVVFLPGRVPVHVPPAPSTAAAPPAPGATPAPATPGPGPFDQAQQARLRKQSQDALEALLDAQQSLQKINVKNWAKEEYAAAVKLAEAGDAAYREQHFQDATGKYQDALAAMQALLKRSETVFADALARGNKALKNGDARTATSAFQTALDIRPGDQAAGDGLKRAGTLDQVTALLDRGQTLVESGQLDEAQAAFQQALGLDGASEAAHQGLDRVAQLKTGRRFAAAMSRGYASLDAGKLEDAAAAFRDAAAIKPGATDARNALEQVRQKLTNRSIDGLLSDAQKLAQDEKWHDAQDRYDAALKLDGSLVTARQGSQRAAQRAALDDRLRAAIARPDRLSDPDVYRETSALLGEAGAVSAPGPVLSKQLADLDRLLKQAATPVSVTLTSDNTTRVTVYKVGELGQFERQDISLRPGRYVAVGSRPGYRDVRVEFTVSAQKANAPVDIQCQEKIASGS